MSPGTGVGSLVVFLDAGGHSLEMMNDCNARLRAGARPVTRDGEVVETQRLETIADLCALDLTPDFLR